MKIYKQSYVGIKLTQSNEENTPLAFLAPYEDNAAGRKRMDTVDQWVSYHFRKDVDEEDKIRTGQIMDNKPMKGFRISGWNSRYSTDNKTVRVTDPRGFELEIYIPNLTELILTTTMVNGEIQDECIWARDGANNALIKVGGKDYNEAWIEGQKIAPTVGDIVRDGRGNEYVFMGKQKVTFHACKKRIHSYDQWKRPVYSDISAEPISSTLKTPMFLYLERKKLEEDGPWSHGTIRKSQMKVEQVVGRVDTLPDLTKEWNLDEYMHFNSDGSRWVFNKWENSTDHYTKSATFEPV